MPHAEPTIAEMALAVARELEDESRWCSGYMASDRDGKKYDEEADVREAIDIDGMTADAFVCACPEGRALLLFGSSTKLCEAYSERFSTAIYQDNDGRGREFVRARLLELAGGADAAR